MREQHKTILPGFFQNGNGVASDAKTLKNVQHYRDIYKWVDTCLQKYPEIEGRVHDDLRPLCTPNPTRNRTPDFTSQNLFRAVLVMRIENLSSRDASIDIAEKQTLQNFCRLCDKETINHHLISLTHRSIATTTWQYINTVFAHHMAAEGKINPEQIRVDTTVVETNIHYPTDSSLCWDTYRTIDRIVEKARELGFGQYLLDFRFHPEKIKKLDFDINRFSASKCNKRKRLVRTWYDTIIDRTAEAVLKAKEIVRILNTLGDETAASLGTVLTAYLPTMEKIVSVARRRYDGEEVLHEEKVFSLFEPHTELLKRGKRNKPIEFGHLILLTETPEKFITDALAFEISPPDCTLIPMVMDRHEEIFGAKPKGAAMDKGFHPGQDKFEDLLDEYEDEVEFLGVPARLNDLANEEMSRYQRFRAGIEGTISGLKRIFGLSRCLFKGFKGFCQCIGSAIFSHNLLTMFRADLKAAES
jgi:IS5 family transposase